MPISIIGSLFISFFIRYTGWKYFKKLTKKERHKLLFIYFFACCLAQFTCVCDIFLIILSLQIFHTTLFFLRKLNYARIFNKPIVYIGNNNKSYIKIELQVWISFLAGNFEIQWPTDHSNKEIRKKRDSNDKSTIKVLKGV
jgi:hypothetical protein